MNVHKIKEATEVKKNLVDVKINKKEISEEAKQLLIRQGFNLTENEEFK